MNKICIIGTDTGIGKTYVCCQILYYLSNHEKKSLALKPISSGIIDTDKGKVNEDVYDLYMASNIKLGFDQMNPFSFNDRIAPHIAAEIDGVELNIKSILDASNRVMDTINCDYILIEGVGGLMVPLNVQQTYLDLLMKWNYPVIMVVGMRLGCLNHALLTESGLINSGLNVLGWVANSIDPDMDVLRENLYYLRSKLSMPLLAIVPFDGDLQPTDKFYEIFK